MELKVIAKIHTEFPDKFGIPRQSGLVPSLRGEIIFEPEFRNPDGVKGLEEFSHIWLLWEFSKAKREGYALTVTPPRLGGKVKKGVFATRAPYRPNPIGLSSVKLEEIRMDEKLGPVLTVSGADLLDGTPIYDIKPYIKYADSRPEAVCGYVDNLEERSLKVIFPPELSSQMPDRSVIPALMDVLRLDPRPSYHDDPHRIYGLSFCGLNVRFRVEADVLTITAIERDDCRI